MFVRTSTFYVFGFKLELCWLHKTCSLAPLKRILGLARSAEEFWNCADELDANFLLRIIRPCFRQKSPKVLNFWWDRIYREKNQNLNEFKEWWVEWNQVTGYLCAWWGLTWHSTGISESRTFLKFVCGSKIFLYMFIHHQVVLSLTIFHSMHVLL